MFNDTCSIMFNPDYSMGISIVPGFPAINYFSLSKPASAGPMIVSAVATHNFFFAVPLNAPVGATVNVIVKGKLEISLTDRNGFFTSGIPANYIAPCGKYFFEMRNAGKVIARLPINKGMIRYQCSSKGAVDYSLMPTWSPAVQIPATLTEEEIVSHAVLNASRLDPSWLTQIVNMNSPLLDWKLSCTPSTLKIWWNSDFYDAAKKLSSNINSIRCPTFCKTCRDVCRGSDGRLDFSKTSFSLTNPEKISTSYLYRFLSIVEMVC